MSTKEPHNQKFQTIEEFKKAIEETYGSGKESNTVEGEENVREMMEEQGASPELIELVLGKGD